MACLTPGQAMASARYVATAAMPYFGAGILSLVPREKPGLGSVAVTSEDILLFDPDVFRSWSAAEAGTVVLHEYLHRFFGHDVRYRRLVSLGQLDGSQADMALWNKAADCEINDNLEDAGLPFPKGPNGETHITPKRLGLPEHLTAEEYVVLLKKERDGKSGGGEPGSSGGGGQSESPPGPGHCGSGAGYPVPDEPAGDPDGRSEVDQAVQRKADAEAIKAHASKGRGDLPAGLRRYAEGFLEPPKISWAQKLAVLSRAAIAYRPGATDYTRSRPSRRQAALGSGPGAPLLPAMRSSVVSVAVVADTSGSMGDAQLQKILNEVQGIFRAQAGAQVTFCACDAEVHTLTKVRNVSEIRAGIKGGGGTDFRPAFQALDRFKPRPEVVVFATDGFGPAPDVPPKGMKVIWLIVDGKNSCPWGEVVEVDDGRVG